MESSERNDVRQVSSDRSTSLPGREPVSGDGPPDEIEPGTAIKGEVGRIVRDPRGEISRLELVEKAGESGATPYLYLFQGLKLILPAAAVMLTVALLCYYLS